MKNSSQGPMYSVVAYITAYQDSAALHRCLRAIQDQDYPISRTVVVDNSPVSLLEDRELENGEMDILVWSYPQNIGVAGGISKLMQWAEKQEYDFVWLFDQDSEPKSDCLSQLVYAYSQLVVKCSVGIVAPTPVDPRTQYVVPAGHFINDRFEGIEPGQGEQSHLCDAPITSGSLLWVKTVESVPPPDTRLFIDGIDLDHGLRLRQAGYKNFVISQSVMSHHFGYPIQISFLGQKKMFQAYSALRHFYICRNHTYLELKFSQGIYKVSCILRRLKFLCTQVIWLSVSRTDGKLEKIQACLRGTYYGFWGDLDQQFYGRNKTSPEIQSKQTL